MNFFVQFLFLFTVVIFQISFLNVIFPSFLLNTMLATAISLVLTRGFFAAWPWIVFMGCLFDILSMDIVGVTPSVLILFSYGVSFVSRRFLVEHRDSSMVLAVLFMVVTTLFYIPLVWIVQSLVLDAPLSVDVLTRYFSAVDFFFMIIANAVLFVAVYAITTKIHALLHFYEDRVIVKR